MKREIQVDRLKKIKRINWIRLYYQSIDPEEASKSQFNININKQGNKQIKIKLILILLNTNARVWGDFSTLRWSDLVRLTIRILKNLN